MLHHGDANTYEKKNLYVKVLTSAMIHKVVFYPVVMVEEATATFDTQAVMDLILKRNAAYLTSIENPSDITPDLCEDSADND